MDAQGEITALERLTAAKCPYTPKLLSTKRTKQNDTMWVPGGYLIYILMERLPGRPITAFFDSDGKRPAMTLSQRDEVRKAFKTALS